MTTEDLKHLNIDCTECGCDLWQHTPESYEPDDEGRVHGATRDFVNRCPGDREIQAILALIALKEGAEVVKLNIQNNQHFDPFYRACICTSLRSLEALGAIQ